MMEYELKCSHYHPQTCFSLKALLKPEKERACWGHSFTHAQLHENMIFYLFLKADLNLSQRLKRVRLRLKTWEMTTLYLLQISAAPGFLHS